MMDKLCESCPDNYTLIAQDKYSKTYLTTKKMIVFKKPRILSEKQKLQLVNMRSRLNQK